MYEANDQYVYALKKNLTNFPWVKAFNRNFIHNPELKRKGILCEIYIKQETGGGQMSSASASAFIS